MVPHILQAFQRAGPVVQRELGRAWTAFEAADPATQQLLLDGILARCSMAQRSYACELLRKVMYVDFIAALPPELALRILLHLDALSLCRASQVRAVPLGAATLALRAKADGGRCSGRLALRLR